MIIKVSNESKYSETVIECQRYHVAMIDGYLVLHCFNEAGMKTYDYPLAIQETEHLYAMEGGHTIDHRIFPREPAGKKLCTDTPIVDK
jgi:hypothetical protein